MWLTLVTLALAAPPATATLTLTATVVDGPRAPLATPVAPTPPALAPVTAWRPGPPDRPPRAIATVHLAECACYVPKPGLCAITLPAGTDPAAADE